MQIEAGLTANNGSAFGFLNNFFAKLPHSSTRRLLASEDMLDEPVTRTFDSEEDISQRELFSARFLATTTRREFFDDIDDAVDDSGLDVDELRRLQEASTSSLEDLDSISTYALPVYKALRMMGYSHYDLWG
jgi:hypothetical protein